MLYITDQPYRSSLTNSTRSLIFIYCLPYYNRFAVSGVFEITRKSSHFVKYVSANWLIQCETLGKCIVMKSYPSGARRHGDSVESPTVRPIGCLPIGFGWVGGSVADIGLMRHQRATEVCERFHRIHRCSPILHRSIHVCRDMWRSCSTLGLSSPSWTIGVGAQTLNQPPLP